MLMIQIENIAKNIMNALQKPVQKKKAISFNS